MIKYNGINKIKIAVFVSGKGSNLLNLIKFSKKKNSLISIDYIVSSSAKAYGLKYAKEYNIKKIISFPSTKLNQKKILKLFNQKNIKLICLAGYMKILPASFIKDFKGKIINIHPSLLPKYKGLNTFERVIQNKEKFTGSTVHYVNKKLDSGKIIYQKKIKILQKDNIKSLERKVKKIEFEIYPISIIKIINHL